MIVKTIVVDGKLTSNQLYQLNIYKRIHKNTAETSNITTIKNNTWDQWHRRLGHVSILGLQQLLNDNLVNSSIKDCDAPRLSNPGCRFLGKLHLDPKIWENLYIQMYGDWLVQHHGQE